MENEPIIYFESDEIVVAEKPEGVTSEEGMKKLLSPREVFTVHRLDKEVGGVMVFAKTSKAAEKLSREIREGNFKKEYLAVCFGETDESGELSDLLFHDKEKNKTYVVKKERKGVKKAKLTYKKLGKATLNGNIFSLLSVELFTGRTHQIRVQFASRKHPLSGDRKYGSAVSGRMGLHSVKLTFSDPSSSKQLSFVSLPKGDFWTEFENSGLFPQGY